MTDFKAGDRAEVKSGALEANWNGAVVTVTETDRRKYGGVWDLTVTREDGKEALVNANELKLVKPEPKFKVGDWVKVHGRHDRWDGTVGTVQEVKERTFGSYGHLYTILRNDKVVGEDHTLRFFEGALEATEAPKPKQEFAKGGFLPNYAAADVKFTEAIFGKINGDKPEAVDGPAHYGGKDNPYEVIKVAEAWGFEKNAYLFNALKYLGRAEHKGRKVEDLKKLVFYAEREIALEEAK